MLPGRKSKLVSYLIFDATDSGAQLVSAVLHSSICTRTMLIYEILHFDRMSHSRSRSRRVLATCCMMNMTMTSRSHKLSSNISYLWIRFPRFLYGHNHISDGIVHDRGVTVRYVDT